MMKKKGDKFLYFQSNSFNDNAKQLFSEIKDHKMESYEQFQVCAKEEFERTHSLNANDFSTGAGKKMIK